MLSEGFRNIYIAPLLIVWPALAIGLTVGSLALLGNALRDALKDSPKVKANRKAVEAAIQAGALTDSVAGVNVTLVGPEDAQDEVPVETDLATTPQVPDDTTGHLLQVHNLAIGYPLADGRIKRVVDGVSFHVDKGEVLSIVGESGSGKSQTAFAILGLLPEAARIVGGSIVIDGSTP